MEMGIEDYIVIESDLNIATVKLSAADYTLQLLTQKMWDRMDEIKDKEAARGLQEIISDVHDTISEIRCKIQGRIDTIMEAKQ